MGRVHYGLSYLIDFSTKTCDVVIDGKRLRGICFERANRRHVGYSVFQTYTIYIAYRYVFMIRNMFKLTVTEATWPGRM